jgi:hypothetical protein
MNECGTVNFWLFSCLKAWPLLEQMLIILLFAFCPHIATFICHKSFQSSFNHLILGLLTFFPYLLDAFNSVWKKLSTFQEAGYRLTHCPHNLSYYFPKLSIQCPLLDFLTYIVFRVEVVSLVHSPQPDGPRSYLSTCPVWLGSPCQEVISPLA